MCQCVYAHCACGFWVCEGVIRNCTVQYKNLLLNLFLFSSCSPGFYSGLTSLLSQSYQPSAVFSFCIQLSPNNVRTCLTDVSILLSNGHVRQLRSSVTTRQLQRNQTFSLSAKAVVCKTRCFLPLKMAAYTCI